MHVVLFLHLESGSAHAGSVCSFMENQTRSPSQGVENRATHRRRRDSDLKEMLVFPWSGVIQNISCRRGDSESLKELDVGPGVDELLQLLKDLNTCNAHVFRGKLGQPGVAIVQFHGQRDQDSYNNAKAFHRYFTKRGHSREHWLKNTANKERPGCNLYGWLANDEDYYGHSGNAAVATYLQATAHLTEFHAFERSGTIEDEHDQMQSLPDEASPENGDINPSPESFEEETESSGEEYRFRLMTEKKKVRGLEEKLAALMARKKANEDEDDRLCRQAHELVVEQAKVKDLEEKLAALMATNHAKEDELVVERAKVEDLENRLLDLLAEKKACEEALDRNRCHADAVKASFQVRIKELEKYVEDLKAFLLDEKSNNHLHHNLEESDVLDSNDLNKPEGKVESGDVQKEVDDLNRTKTDTEMLPCSANLTSPSDDFETSVEKAIADKEQTVGNRTQVEQLRSVRVTNLMRDQATVIVGGLKRYLRRSARGKATAIADEEQTMGNRTRVQQLRNVGVTNLMRDQSRVIVGGLKRYVRRSARVKSRNVNDHGEVDLRATSGSSTSMPAVIRKRRSDIQGQRTRSQKKKKS